MYTTNGTNAGSRNNGWNSNATAAMQTAAGTDYSFFFSELTINGIGRYGKDWAIRIGSYANRENPEGLYEQTPSTTNFIAEWNITNSITDGSYNSFDLLLTDNVSGTTPIQLSAQDAGSVVTVDNTDPVFNSITLTNDGTNLDLSFNLNESLSALPTVTICDIAVTSTGDLNGNTFNAQLSIKDINDSNYLSGLFNKPSTFSVTSVDLAGNDHTNTTPVSYTHLRAHET